MRQASSNFATRCTSRSQAWSSRPVERSGRSSGFTLIELLVVIVIIGILIGILVPGVMSAYRRSQEFAIEQEVNQLSLAIEAFKTKYGFYPPDFTRITSVNEFLPYLNRIAPNHSETANLNAWWTQVGSKLQAAGPQASYVFWLSGLAKNKQYPLTGNTGNPLPAYNVGTVEREVFYDFKNERLYEPISLNLIGSITPPPAVATYSQFAGTCQPFVYFEVKSLTAVPAPYAVNTSAGTFNMSPYNNGTEFYNKDSFQLIAPGMDACFSANPSNSPNVANCNVRERDNITNFSEGRLERTITQ